MTEKRTRAPKPKPMTLDESFTVEETRQTQTTDRLDEIETTYAAAQSYVHCTKWTGTRWQVIEAKADIQWLIAEVKRLRILIAGMLHADEGALGQAVLEARIWFPQLGDQRTQALGSQQRPTD